MRYSALQTALTVALALCACSCSTCRTSATSEVSNSRFQETRDTVREQVVVAVHDTVMETKTITITKNEDGDTTFTSIVTERDRFRDRTAVKDKEEKLVVRTDTVYIEHKDSVSNTRSTLVASLAKNYTDLFLSSVWVVFFFTLKLVFHLLRTDIHLMGSGNVNYLLGRVATDNGGNNVIDKFCCFFIHIAMIH